MGAVQCSAVSSPGWRSPACHASLSGVSESKCEAPVQLVCTAFREAAMATVATVAIDAIVAIRRQALPFHFCSCWVSER